MDDSVNELVHFLMWPLPETAMSLQCICLVGAIPHTHGAEVRFSPHKNYLTRPPAVVTAKNKTKNGSLAV